MEQKEITRLYKESENCINAAIDKILRKNPGFNRDDLLSKANEIFWKCTENYNPKTGNFLNYLSTTLYFSLFSEFLRLTGHRRILKGWVHEKKIEEMVFENESAEEKFAVSLDNPVNELISATLANMSSDAQAMTAAIFNPPVSLHEKIENSPSRKITKGNLYKYFREVGWVQRRIFRAFWEIKSGLHEVWA